MTSKKLIAIACLNQSIHWFIFGLIIPVITLLQLEKGLNYFQIGITLAMYSGATVLLELPTGGLADSIGRKRVYLISLIVTFISTIIILFAQSFVGMIIGFAFMGCARALSSGSMDAWFVDEFYKIEAKDKLQHALAKIGFFIPVGLGMGCLIAGWLPTGFGNLTTQISGFTIYSSNLIAIGIMVIIQFSITQIVVKEELQSRHPFKILDGFKQFPNIVKTSLQYGIKNRTLFLLLMSTFAWGVAISGLELLWQPRVKNIINLESGTMIFGVLATGYFMADALGNILISKICNIFKNAYPMILFYTRTAMGVFLLILAFQSRIIGFTFFYWTLFIFNGMSNSPHAAIFNSAIPTDKRSTLLSFESLFLQIGGLLGSLIMGYLANTLSISIAWILGAIILIISSFAYVYLPNHSKKPLKKYAYQTEKKYGSWLDC
ncbi:MAG: MFS transporter [Deltaproteobacteria bacterium]|nr:MFS transporter [Deltaproteobacteria bacterium]